jgi:sodium/pantothenate symporter
MASQELVWATAALLALYGAAILYFVIRGAMRIKSISDYAVGSIQFSPVVVGLSLAASITSAATFIINPGFIALYGISGILALGVVLPIGVYVSLVVLTKSFRKHGSSVKALTMAQWIGKRYGSRGYALFFGFLSLLLITFIVLICVGMTKVMAKALNAEELYVLIGLVIFVFGYMMFGGANSMVYTNTIQAVLMIIVAVILLGSGYEHFSEGVKGFIDKLAAVDPLLAQPTNPESFLFRDYFEIIFCSLVVGVAIVCQPHIITKSLLLKDERDVNRYLLVGILVEALFFAVVIAGLFARLRFPDLTVDGEVINMDGIIPAYVVTEFPVAIGLIVILGLLSAGLSTLEGLIQSLSSTITSDIIEPLAGRSLGAEAQKSKRLIFINKIVIVLLAVVSILLSYQQLLHPSLSVGIFAQNGVYAYFSAAFVPVLMGIFLKEVPRIAPIAASLSAVVIHFGTYYGRIGVYMQEAVRNPAVAATYAILGSLVVGFGLYYLLKDKKTPTKNNPPSQKSPSQSVASPPSKEQKQPKGPKQDNMQAKLSQYVSLSDGVDLHFTVSGSGQQTLLFVHGLGSNHKAWDKLTAHLGKHFRCISIDLPGYGASSTGDHPYGIPFFARKINEFVRKQAYQDVILVGHSMGGQSSIAAVLEAPSLYQKLVLVAPAGFESFNAAAMQWVRTMYKPALLKAMSEDQIIRNFEANFYQFPEDAQFMIDDRMQLRADDEAYSHYCRMIPKCVMGMLDAPVFERLPEITLPTLIFYGEDDQLIPNKILNPTLTTERVARKGANRIPDSRIVMLPRCGHFAQWECAQEIAAELRAFAE